MILTTSCNYSIHVIYKPTRNWGAHCKTILISSTTEFKIRRQLWLGALMITLLWYVAPKHHLNNARMTWMTIFWQPFHGLFWPSTAVHNINQPLSLLVSPFCNSGTFPVSTTLNPWKKYCTGANHVNNNGYWLIGCKWTRGMQPLTPFKRADLGVESDTSH